MIARAVFSTFRWWGFTSGLVERDARWGQLLSYRLDSGPDHPVVRAWERYYPLLPAPPAPDAGIDARAAWLRATVDGPGLALDPRRLVPAWFYEQAHLPGGPDFEREILEAFQRPAPLWIRRVDSRPLPGIVLEAHPSVPLAARARSATSLYDHPAFRAGAFEVQDLASQAVGLACAPRPGERWWDACAGHGGKSLHLAALMKGKGAVVATDVKPYKLEEARRRVRRANYQNVELRAWTGKRIPAKERSFDGVLVDAPCAGVGTWRRNPDARWRTAAEDVRELSAIQAKVLGRAAKGVKPGGRLVYAVCSLTRSETLEVVDSFVAGHRDFRLLPTPHPLTNEATDGRIWVWPQVGDSDGMFIAMFERVAGATNS